MVMMIMMMMIMYLHLVNLFTATTVTVAMQIDVVTQLMHYEQARCGLSVTGETNQGRAALWATFSVHVTFIIFVPIPLRLHSHRVIIHHNELHHNDFT